jgi:SAM-dependent methyltransferase
LVPFVYIPIGSRRNSQVVQCGSCGLCQTFQDTDTEHGKRTLSSDAGWGNVRHAKGVRLEAQQNNLKNLLTTISETSSVLDIGSSRGQFIEWCQANFPKFTFVGIESDSNIVNIFEKTNVRVIIDKLEKVKFQENERFDFIFCNHTLEHVDDVNQILDIMSQLIKPNGIIWIDVPNLEGIRDPFVIEEFFIDKHNYHFELATLSNILTSKGFQIKLDYSDNLNLVFAVTNGAERNFTPIKNRITTKDITNYIEKLNQNRLKLPGIARIIESKSNVAIYGAGRILDALIRFGDLKIDYIPIADRYLWKNASDLGVNIQNPDLMNWEQFNEVIILGRSSVPAITSWLESRGAKKVTPISALWS